MKKTLAFIVLVALLVNCAHTIPHYFDYERKRPIVISERVGETIEPEEREQFDLFHGIDEFKAAIFYSISDDGYEVEILTENKRLAAVNRDSLAITVLRDYINRYEEIQGSKADFEEKWKIVDYDNLGQPITQYEVTQIRSRRFCCSGGISGGIAGCLGGGLILIPIMVILDMNDIISEEDAEGGAFYGMAISAVLGAWLGPKIFSNTALKAIKESRKPRVVE